MKCAKQSATSFRSTSNHSIICIGALVTHCDNGAWVVDALGAPHVGDRTEKQLITAFVDKIAELSPQLVTFNGNSFELPVLRYRAMINKVPAPGLAARSYFNCYTEDALDLCLRQTKLAKIPAVIAPCSTKVEG